MKKTIALFLLIATFAAWAQSSSEASRLQISNTRTQLEAGFVLEDTACYKKFLVNNCLEEVTARRRAVMANLRSQEIVLNEQDRKIKAAEQLKKTEDKSSAAKKQQAADSRNQALKDSSERVARDLEKNAARVTSQTNAKVSADTAKSRAKDAQDKQASRVAKQAAAAEELNKYNQRLAKAQERATRLAKEKAGQTKPPAAPLPVPK